MRALRIALIVAIAGPQLLEVDGTDWPSHDHDAAGQRFSPLKQITPSNVAKLQIAWTFDTGVTGLQVTPLVINGIMYVTAGKDIVALEPETAKVIWKYTAPAAVSRRGVAYWPSTRSVGNPPLVSAKTARSTSRPACEATLTAASASSHHRPPTRTS